MNLLLAYISIALTKLKYSIFFALLFSPISIFFAGFKKYLLTDIEFFVILAFAIMIDLFVGAGKHLKFRTFDHKQLLYGLMEKVFISIMAALLFSLFYYIFEDAGQMNVLYYFKFTCRMVLIIYMAIPTLVNMSKITDGKFPPSGILVYLKKYNETLDPRELAMELQKEDNEDRI